MAVQTFLVEEASPLIYDNDKLQAWHNHVESLGLAGQLKLMQNASNSSASPNPFTPMNTVMQRVYETLCPSKMNYKDYDKSAIPVEVLDLIALAEREGYFVDIKIWYDDKTPDPIAVGYGSHQYEFMRPKFLIAKWGDVIEPFDQLLLRARKIFFKQRKAELQNKMIESKQKLESIQVDVVRYFQGHNSL